MRIGVALPQSMTGTAEAAAQTRRFAQRAEERGFDSLWVQEQLLGSDPSLEPIVNLTFVAACTERIGLGTAAIIAPPRNAVVLAKQLSSLDRLSGGRLIAGLALGDMPQLYEASGVPLAGRGERLDELVEVITALWSGEGVDIDDEYRRIDDARMTPTPVRRPHPPIWFGGHSPQALARAARIGQGWIGAGGATPAAFLRSAATLRTLRPDADDFTIAKKVYLAVEDDAGRARERMAEWFAAHWGPGHDPYEMADGVSIHGTPDDCAAALSELAANGRPDLLVINPVYDEYAQMERFAEEVLPGIRDTE